jgi:hypothetical protein
MVGMMGSYASLGRFLQAERDRSGHVGDKLLAEGLDGLAAEGVLATFGGFFVVARLKPGFLAACLGRHLYMIGPEAPGFLTEGEAQLAGGFGKASQADKVDDTRCRGLFIGHGRLLP